MTGRCEVKSPDAEGQRPVDSSKVLERENPDRTRPVNADRTLIRFRLLTGRSSAYDRTLGVQRSVDISMVPVKGKHDRTRSVMFSPHWNLTDVDQMLDLQSPVTC